MEINQVIIRLIMLDSCRLFYLIYHTIKTLVIIKLNVSLVCSWYR